MRGLPPEGIVIVVVLFLPTEATPNPVFPPRELPLQLSDFEVRPAWEGQVAPNVPEYRLVAAVGGRDVDVAIFFGTQDPPPEVLRAAQEELDRLVIPVEAGSHAGYGPRCTQATTSGDFDGDGAIDEARLVALVPADVSCDRNHDVWAQMESQQIDVAFGSGQSLEGVLADCQPCHTGTGAFAATDLDGDGRDELAIDVGPGAAIDYVEFYRLDPDGIRPLIVAEPGDPPYVEPGPAILGGGFDSGQWSPIECRVTSAGTRELISVHAENLTGPIAGPWRVHTTTMALEGDRLVVTSTDEVKSENYTRPSAVFLEACS
jgi:hypothetical protein